MKALILSGGRGTRLRPITHTNAKQLIPVANKPILFYALEAMERARIREVGIVVGDTRREIFRACGNGAMWNLRITYIPQTHPLGLAHAVKISRPFIGADSFIMYLGDNIIKEGVESLVGAFLKDKPDAQILLARTEHPEQFGVAELVGGKVVRLKEKPVSPKSNLALVGVYIFSPLIFDAVENITPSRRNELEITDAIQYLIDRGYSVVPHIITGWWKDTGKVEDLLEANRFMLSGIQRRISGKTDKSSSISGCVRIEKGADISKSIIKGPVIIGRNATIRRSVVGPYTSVASGALIESSSISDSIVLEHSTIARMGRLTRSVIGQNVVFLKDRKYSRGVQIVAGDSSRMVPAGGEKYE